MADIYNDSTYLKNNPGWHEEDAQLKAGKIMELLGRNALSCNSVCDIGCGSGEILVQLASRMQEVDKFVGMDVSKDAISLARKKETEKIRFKQADLSHMASTDVFDLLLVIDVIEHVENYFSFLNAVALRGKYTIFHIPLDMCVWSLFREKMLIESKARIGHIHNFTEDFITSVLEDKGFQILDKIYTEPSFEQMTRKQKLVNGIRKVLFKVHKRFCTKTIGGYSILLLAENSTK